VGDITGTTTTATTFVDIPGFSLTFFLDSEAECLLYMSLWTSVLSTSDYSMGYYRMVIDNTPITATQRQCGFSATRSGTVLTCTGAVTAVTKRVLIAGQHVLKGQFAAYPNGETAVLTRTIGLLALNR